MMANPYRWQHDHPTHFVARDELVNSLVSGLRGGLALKLIGGRGMGKSVLLQQVQTRFVGEPTTRVVLVNGPAEEGTLPAFVQDIAGKLGLAPLSRPAMDHVMELASQKGIDRIILLLDEADQYVLLGGGEVARTWFNRLEATRKAWPDRIGIVIAGGLGLLHLAHVLGSGLLSRADSFIAAPFALPELRELARPFATRGEPLGEDVIETLAVLSGGNPALATFGLQHIWAGGDPIPVLRSKFGSFPSHHADFLRAVQDSVSHRGLVQAPGRVLALVRKHGANVSREQLTEACAPDTPHVDLQQALQLLEAAGLVRVSGSPLGGPLKISPVPSIINLPTAPSGGASAPEQLLSDIISLLGNIHRFGRDFHGPNGRGRRTCTARDQDLATQRLQGHPGADRQLPHLGHGCGHLRHARVEGSGGVEAGLRAGLLGWVDVLEAPRPARSRWVLERGDRRRSRYPPQDGAPLGAHSKANLIAVGCHGARHERAGL
ncbi:MAG: ATP-binding protein [Polyangiaceae bacterium]|nr:ATP-binding protein [Polyangiaceae bacterium]